MRWYFVPPNLNEGSAFQQHLVLVWTTAGHAYAYGFHVVDTIADARALDLELVRHLPQRTTSSRSAGAARDARSHGERRRATRPAGDYFRVLVSAVRVAEWATGGLQWPKLP